MRGDGLEVSWGAGEMTVRILIGDAREQLRSLPDNSVHCIVSSPPYWRQRDYGMEGQLGLESTPEAYIDDLVAIFREARRVLRSDGTCWVNLGDKWAAGCVGYKDKDLVGIPWMFAFAARADGWYLRQCNVWAKPNCMPESVSDRSTISHEYVFQLTKSNDYFYDSEAARTPAAPSSETRLAQNVAAQNGSERANGGDKTNGPMRAVHKQDGHGRKHAGFNARWDAKEASAKAAAGDPRVVAGAAPGIDSRKHAGCTEANLRSVWCISPAQFREGHYAVMPDRLAEICIAAGSPPGGVILDPFGGAGTTGLVADRMQRDAILVELNPEYAEMARRRIHGDSPLFAEVA